jgi:hypothetical protein
MGATSSSYKGGGGATVGGASAKSPPCSQVISGQWVESEEMQSKKDVRERQMVR